MHGRERMARGVGADHAAFLHQCLAGGEPALAVLVVDQRQPLLVKLRGAFRVAAGIGVDDLANSVRVTPAGHRAGPAGIEIRDQRDAFLAIPWPIIASPPSSISSRS